MKKQNPKVRVTKIFYFEMAHALYGYDGPCKNIHGHSYVLSVTVLGKINSNARDPKCGMVIDFCDLKQIVQEPIINRFDHSLVLNRNSPHKKFAKKNPCIDKIQMVNYQPTCENLTIDFVRIIQKQ